MVVGISRTETIVAQTVERADDNLWRRSYALIRTSLVFVNIHNLGFALAGLRWLRLNNVGLENIPSQITQLDKVEHLSVNNNKLHAIPSRITTLQNLRVLRSVARWNISYALVFMSAK